MLVHLVIFTGWRQLRSRQRRRGKRKMKNSAKLGKLWCCVVEWVLAREHSPVVTYLHF
jgi:hypothetical protein